jgi:signal transduction histidine kinase
MSKQNPPIEISFVNTGKSYIYYEDSAVLKQLRYYPFVQFMIVIMFILLSYFGFYASKRAEQNSVWLGMAKETAHQLGTPMSSLMAISELLKLKNIDQTLVDELEKDINRLNNITERFSKIGSPPQLTNLNIVEVIENAVNYMRARISKNISIEVVNEIGGAVFIPLNSNLFEWVIENLCKNAIDAMSGEGKVTIRISNDNDHIHIDVSDTGKGLSKSMFYMIFTPGYSTKKRGWGLGLSLSKRIIENYHKGKIFVKNSTLNKGTTFRIIIKK